MPPTSITAEVGPTWTHLAADLGDHRGPSGWAARPNAVRCRADWAAAASIAAVSRAVVPPRQT